MFQYRAIWQVPGGGTGYSVFHVRESPGAPIGTSVQLFADAVRLGFTSFSGIIPNDVQISFDTEAIEMDVSTGQLTGVHGVTAPAPITGGSAASWAPPVGARVDLLTNSVVAGRRLRGRTFIVPLGSSAFSVDTGQILTSARDDMNEGFEVFRDDALNWSLGVYSRTHGVLADVTQCSANIEAAVLRSRRD